MTAAPDTAAPKTTRLSIFPLPGALLFPGMHLPLHIFEPRYRAMISDSMARDRRIGMIQPRPGPLAPNEPPALFDIGCVGRIAEFETSEDGRYNLVLEGVALFRIVATESYRFPELAAKMRDGAKRRVEYAIANYFRGQIARGTLTLADPDRAAALFKQMICSELQECLLFGGADAMIRLDFTAHLNHVIDIFLFGAVPRAARPTPL